MPILGTGRGDVIVAGMTILVAALRPLRCHVAGRSRSRAAFRAGVRHARAAFVRVELHCHSTRSDGSHAADEVARRAARTGVRAVLPHRPRHLRRLRSHPRCARRRAMHGAARARAELPRVRSHRARAALRSAERAMRSRPAGYASMRSHARASRPLVAILRRLRRLGIELDDAAILSRTHGRTPGRPDVARALVEAGVVRTPQDAFTRFLRDGGPADVPLIGSGSTRAWRWVAPGRCARQPRASAQLGDPSLVRALFERHRGRRGSRASRPTTAVRVGRERGLAPPGARARPGRDRRVGLPRGPRSPGRASRHRARAATRRGPHPLARISEPSIEALLDALDVGSLHLLDRRLQGAGLADQGGPEVDHELQAIPGVGAPTQQASPGRRGVWAAAQRGNSVGRSPQRWTRRVPSSSVAWSAAAWRSCKLSRVWSIEASTSWQRAAPSAAEATPGTSIEASRDEATRDPSMIDRMSESEASTAPDRRWCKPARSWM